MNSTTTAAECNQGSQLTSDEVSAYRRLGYHSPIRVMSAEQAAGYMAKLTAHEAAHGKLEGGMRHKAHLYLTA